MGALIAFDDDVVTTGTATADVSVTGMSSMLVMWVIPDSGAVGDLSTTSVRPYTPSIPGAAAGPVLIDNFIPAVAVAAARRVAPVTSKLERYDVSGLERVQLSLVNAAGSTRNLVMYVFLSA